ncbi:MAG: hypothetical protein ACYC7L_11665 [Nitrospirota bacterium]
MKKTVVMLAVALMVAVMCTGAFAANSLDQGTFGLSVGFNNLSSFPDGLEDTIFAKFLVSDDLALIAGFGFTSASGDPGMPDGTDLSLVLGVRKYLKQDDFAPFAEGLLVYMNQDTTARDTIGVLGNFGAEYFLHKQFSLEGSAGIGLFQVENSGTSADATILGTTSLGLRANFYF